jgi:NitT/TauT family transport system substrate-binding protein
VKRFMSASTKSLEAASKDPKGAAQAILNANPKGGKIETLTQGFELTIPLYKDPAGKANRPFNVADANMTDTINVMVEYGGLDAKAKDNPRDFYTNEYLPK